MSEAKSRVLVIDASIARAAGTSENPISKDCREFLLAVLVVGHGMGMTREIENEWNLHQSNFTMRWRTAMFARKKIVQVEATRHRHLKRRIQKNLRDPNVSAIVEKDRHLLEAALAADRRIASLDETVRQHLKKHIKSFRDLGSIMWANPTVEREKARDWLFRGAPEEAHRRLDFIDS